MDGAGKKTNICLQKWGFHLTSVLTNALRPNNRCLEAVWVNKLFVQFRLNCARRGETIAGELHAIARVAGEADDDMRDLLGLPGWGFVGHDHGDTLPRLPQRECYTTESCDEADERQYT